MLAEHFRNEGLRPANLVGNDLNASIPTGCFKEP